MSETQSYKKDSSFERENCVIPLTGTIFVLKLVGKSDALQLANELHKAAKSCHAKGAVDMSVLISYGDLHVLAANRFFSALLSLDLFRDLGVEIRYLFAGENDSYYAIPHKDSSYVEKYFLSVSEEKARSVIPLPVEMGKEQLVNLLHTLYWFKRQK